MENIETILRNKVQNIGDCTTTGDKKVYWEVFVSGNSLQQCRAGYES